jgi:hypothetical protein
MKQISNKFSSNVLKIFYKTNARNFSNVYHNFPAVHSYYVNGKYVLLDNLTSAKTLVEEFLSKRWVTKQEIPPKIKVINSTPSLKEIIHPQKNFKNKKMVNIDESVLRYMYEGGYLDRNYFLNVLFEKNEIDLLKEVLDKVVLNGYVVKYFDKKENNDSKEIIVPSNEYQEHIQIKEKINKLVSIFYGKQELSELDKVLQLIYINDKWTIYNHFKYTKNDKFYTVFTDNDYMASKGFIWLPENEFKKENFDVNKTLEGFNLDKYLDTVLLIKKSNTSLLSKVWNKISTNEYYFKTIQKTKIMAYLILSRLFIYLQSQEFAKVFDTELDFYIFNAMVSLHLWLICQRLQNFKRSKFASELIDEILKMHKSYANQEFQQVDTLRKISKFKNIQELYEDQKNTLHMHFNIYNPTVENNFFKIDALVWSQIFREKIPRYDDRVYKMSHYIIHHFNKFKEFNFDDFENFNVTFDLNCIPVNYKDSILVHNEKLSNENLFKEQYSDFVFKKYYYEYKTEIERDTKEMKKTFIRHTHLTTFDKKNFYLRSRRREDNLYDELKDEEKIKEFEEKFNSEYENMEQAGSILNKLYERWAANHFNEVIETCEREDLRRERGEYNEKNLRTIGQDEKMRFSESLDRTMRESLYKYRELINHNPKAVEENFKQNEMKIIHPEANVVMSRRKRKPLVDKIFKLKPY